jgi:hypothetical protein
MIGRDILSLLTDGFLALTNEEIAEQQAWFGGRGQFPPMRVGTSRTGR